MMGDVLYYILTKKWVFERSFNREAAQRILEGHPSEIPAEILNSTDLATKAMVKGIELAWIQDPKERATTKEIAKLLSQQLTMITGDETLNYRVSIPPLPPGYDFSDKEFQSNFRDPRKKA